MYNTFIRSRRLYFGCLRYGHSNRECQHRIRCSKCDRQHPTVSSSRQKRQQQSNFSQVAPLMPPLQSNRPPRSYFEASAPVQFQSTNRGIGSSRLPISPNKDVKLQNNKVNTTNVPISQHISVMIVPVYLSHKSYPNQNKLVYAVLNSQSDTSFITHQTLDPTAETVLNLASMNVFFPTLDQLLLASDVFLFLFLYTFLLLCFSGFSFQRRVCLFPVSQPGSFYPLSSPLYSPAGVCLQRILQELFQLNVMEHHARTSR